MKSFLLACLAAVAIAVIGLVVLSGIQQQAGDAYKTEAVRLGA